MLIARILLVGAAVWTAPSPHASAQGTDKFEKVVPARPAPAKPAPAEPDGPAVTAATDPKLRAALAKVQTPLPEGMTLRAPGAGVPARVRAFYGVWTGKFENGVLCTTVIESIGHAGGMVIHSWGPSPGNFKAGFARARGQFERGVLHTKGDRRKLDYRLVGSDSLEVTLDGPFGLHRAILTRVY